MARLNRRRSRFIDASTNQPLDPSKVALFGGPARIKIETTGEVTLTLDGAPYASASLITGDGLHVLAAHTPDEDLTLKILIDTTPPELTVSTPVANACANAADIQVSGRVFDLTLAAVKVAIGSGQSVNAKVADDGTFAATIPAPAEGKSEIVIEADDHLEHVSVARIPITIDRTRPIIDITSNGAPFAGGAINRPLALFVRAIDADATAIVDVKLNDQPYVIGTPINKDGVYVLRAIARDCAGNASDEKVLQFTFDTVSPKLTAIDPADGSSIGSRQHPIEGTVDSEDLQSAVVDGTSFVGQ